MRTLMMSLRSCLGVLSRVSRSEATFGSFYSRSSRAGLGGSPVPGPVLPLADVGGPRVGASRISTIGLGLSLPTLLGHYLDRQGRTSDGRCALGMIVASRLGIRSTTQKSHATSRTQAGLIWTLGSPNASTSDEISGHVIGIVHMSFRNTSLATLDHVVDNTFLEFPWGKVSLPKIPWELTMLRSPDSW